MYTFKSADILLPVNLTQSWPVIACDQFTSQPQYWEKVWENVGTNPSTLHIILPEIELNGEYESRISQINQTMEKYLQDGIFKEYTNAFVYVERTLVNGKVRKGVIGAVDLEDYDYSADATSNIRATEKTVVERIPPRKKIRQNAPIELPHILLLCDDAKKLLIESVTAVKDQLPLLYDFDLMENGGHITGWLLQGEAAAAFEQQMAAYVERTQAKYSSLGKEPMLFAVGDGNHSLATAKACYEALKEKCGAEAVSDHPSRYALVELENIHDEAQEFEAIHRILTGVEPKELLEALQKECCVAAPKESEAAVETIGIPINWYSKEEHSTVYLDPAKGQLAVGILQNFLDAYLEGTEGEIDYIHGDDALQALAEKDNAIGFLLPAMEKGQLFPGIIMDGVLPRKTFSMGHAQEKRYYMEARKII